MAGPLASSLAEHRDFALAWIGDRTGPAERRQVVVLACGFAHPPTGTASAGLDAEELAEALTSRVRTLGEIVARHGGQMVGGQLVTST